MLSTTAIHTPPYDYVSVNGLKIRYRTYGMGRPLLLLHGWGGSIESMSTIFAEFTKDRAVYALDLPGHGKSELPPTAWGTADFTNCVLKAMDLLDLRTPDIIAHSFGGRVAIQLASLHPDRVGRLVLVDSAGVIPPRPLKYKLRVAIAKVAKFLAKYGGAIGEDLRNYLYSKVASKDYLAAGALRNSLVLVVREDLTGLMPRIKTPTLLVWGENDPDTPVSSGITMQQLIPGSELVVLEHAGHFSYIDQSNQFSLLVKRFLRG
jgi:pimeloyl-ACP methyl ester carboxylesterase